MNSDMNGRVLKSDRCCGESGTFAVTRPDIATQVKLRKEEELRKGVAELREQGGTTDRVKVLTSCPSCLQGLARYQDDVNLEADYIVVEIAKHTLGADWLAAYVRDANQGGIERVLV
jgi:Fe-S oxidoreductase